MDKLGIDNLKKSLKVVYDGVDAVMAAKADGKIDVTDLPLLLPIVMELQPALAGISQVIPEVQDLDDAELADLIQYSKDNCKYLQTHAEIVLHMKNVIGIISNVLAEVKLVKDGAPPQG
jgi:hypothetical protein